MPEFRLNVVTNQWVLVAGNRGGRPHDAPNVPGGQADHGALPEHDPDCPFCPGNEAKLPLIKLERQSEDPDGWSVRVVPNKYPLVDDVERETPAADREDVSRSALGFHEVVIETPRHNGSLERMTAAEVSHLLEVIQARVRTLMEEEAVRWVLPFRNHGRRAGTSLVHPHSQIVAMDTIPRPFADRVSAAQGYFEDQGACVLCEMIGQEERNGVRMVISRPDFSAFVPFAAASPYEVWLVPNEHQADFDQLDGRQLGKLAEALRDLLQKLERGLGGPDYNLMVITAPKKDRGALFFHWYVQLTPRVTTRAGFEIATGINVNASLPEEDAAFLRDVK